MLHERFPPLENFPPGHVAPAKRVAQCPARVVQNPAKRLRDKETHRVTAPWTIPGKVYPDRTIPTQCLRERRDPDQLASKEGQVHLGLVRGSQGSSGSAGSGGSAGGGGY